MRRYLPRSYNENRSLFDAFDSLFKPMFFDDVRDMRTDIKETDEGYQLDIEMPGFKKEEISVSLDDGYLNVRGSKHVEEENGEDKKNKKYLKKEISETFQRSYYVGDEVTEESIKAKYENGILCLDIPKPQPKQIPSHSINIE